MPKRRTSATQLAAVAAFDQRRRDAGLTRVSVWLTPSAQDALAQLQRSTREPRDYLVNLALVRMARPKA